MAQPSNAFNKKHQIVTLCFEINIIYLALGDNESGGNVSRQNCLNFFIHSRTQNKEEQCFPKFLVTIFHIYVHMFLFPIQGRKTTSGSWVMADIFSENTQFSITLNIH